MDELFLFLDEMEKLLAERIEPRTVDDLEDMLQILCVRCVVMSWLYMYVIQILRNE